MVRVTDTKTSIKPGNQTNEFTVNKTATIQVEDEPSLSQTAEQVVEAEQAVCAAKGSPHAQAVCEKEFLLPPSVEEESNAA